MSYTGSPNNVLPVAGSLIAVIQESTPEMIVVRDKLTGDLWEMDFEQFADFKQGKNSSQLTAYPDPLRACLAFLKHRRSVV